MELLPSEKRNRNIRARITAPDGGMHWRHIKFNMDGKTGRTKDEFQLELINGINLGVFLEYIDSLNLNHESCTIEIEYNYEAEEAMFWIHQTREATHEELLAAEEALLRQKEDAEEREEQKILEAEKFLREKRPELFGIQQQSSYYWE